MKSGKTLLIESSLILIAVLCRPGGLSLLKRRTMAEERTLQAIKGFYIWTVGRAIYNLIRADRSAGYFDPLYIVGSTDIIMASGRSELNWAGPWSALGRVC